MSDCRGCDGTCCTGVGSEPCSCPPVENEQPQESSVEMSGLLKALQDRPMVHQPDGGYLTRCPAHEGHDPSLRIRESREGVLVKCHAGCSTDEILAALNLSLADLISHGK